MKTCGKTGQTFLRSNLRNDGRGRMRVLLEETGWMMITRKGATGNGTGEGCLRINWGLDNFDIYLRNLSGDVK